MIDTLYARLGGYDAIATVAENLLSRLTKDPSSVGSGRTAATTACAARSSFSSTSCVPRPAVHCSTSAAT